MWPCCFTCCLQALAGKRWPSDPGGCLVLIWVGRSSSARRTSCTSESNTCCSGFLHTSPGSNTHRSALAETRKRKTGEEREEQRKVFSCKLHFKVVWMYTHMVTEQNRVKNSGKCRIIQKEFTWQICYSLMAYVTHQSFYTSRLQIIAHSDLYYAAVGTVIFQCVAVVEITLAITKLTRQLTLCDCKVTERELGSQFIMIHLPTCVWCGRFFILSWQK